MIGLLSVQSSQTLNEVDHVVGDRGKINKAPEILVLAYLDDAGFETYGSNKRTFSQIQIHYDYNYNRLPYLFFYFVLVKIFLTVMD